LAGREAFQSKANRAALALLRHDDLKRRVIDNSGPLGMIAAVERATIRDLIRLSA
jgi:hypothetical protein